jgi:Methyltransferase domain
VKYSCGCVNEVDADWRVLRSVSKCKYHTLAKQDQPTGLSYYESLGAIKNGTPQCARYIAELQEALDEMQVDISYQADCFEATGKLGRCLEVGCGCSMYVPMLLASYQYTGIDIDEWAINWTSMAFNVTTMKFAIEEVADNIEYWDLILAPHVIEHLVNAPAMLAKMYQILNCFGKLMIIVPDDSDPVNPDHLWFFTEATLGLTLKRIGFKNIKMVSKQRVAHEKFIYCYAEKI